MNFFLYLLLFLSFNSMADELAVSGKVIAPAACSKTAMVWLSLDKENYSERLLLMHTEVPQGGSFRFYVKPGAYQIRASDESGCEYLKKVQLSNESADLTVQMVKK